MQFKLPEQSGTDFFFEDEVLDDELSPSKTETTGSTKHIKNHSITFIKHTKFQKYN